MPKTLVHVKRSSCRFRRRDDDGRATQCASGFDQYAVPTFLLERFHPLEQIIEGGVIQVGQSIGSHLTDDRRQRGTGEEALRAAVDFVQHQSDFVTIRSTVVSIGP